MMLKAVDLSVIYPDGAEAISRLSFELREGERAAVLGANGAGKSTLLLALAGVLLPAGGSLIFDGLRAEKSNLAQWRALSGLVFQDPDDQLFMPSIFEDVSFGLRGRGLSEEEIRERTEKCLAELGIGDLSSRSPLKLSGGEKRAAALASVLVMRPRLLLLDEPTAFLDPRARRRLTALLQERPEAMLLATHDPELARGLCSRILLLKEGLLLADGPAERILSDTGLLDEAGL